MAFTYESKPVLSKIKIGENYYYLKDADLRSIVDTFNENIVKGVLKPLSEIKQEDKNKDVYARAYDIKTYVDQLVAVGIVLVPVDALPDPITKDNLGKIYLVPHDHKQESNVKDEYIAYNSGTEESPVYLWEKIGSTDIDLSSYVKEIAYGAEDRKLSYTTGDGESHDIHAFGKMADADSASGKISTVDSATFDYTPVGTIDVSLKDAEAAATVAYESYTPAGTITAPTITVKSETDLVNVVSANGKVPTFTEGKFTANVPTKIDITKFSGGSMTTGSVTFPTLTGASVATKPTDTFAKAGIVASIGTGTDAETLIFADAATASAMTDVTINGGSLTGGSYTAPLFTQAALGDGFYTEGSAASKVADTFSAGSMPTLASKALVTGASAEATAPEFTGTEALNMKVTGVSYNKQVVDSQTFTGIAAKGTEVSLTKTEKTVTVNPNLK